MTIKIKIKERQRYGVQTKARTGRRHGKPGACRLSGAGRCVQLGRKRHIELLALLAHGAMLRLSWERGGRDACAIRVGSTWMEPCLSEVVEEVCEFETPGPGCAAPPVPHRPAIGPRTGPDQVWGRASDK